MSINQPASSTNSYAAHGFPPELRGRLVKGQISILQNGIAFNSADYQVTLPFTNIRVRIGGHNDEQLFLEHPDFPGWSIHCTDPALLSEPALQGIPEFNTAGRSLDRSRRRIPKPVLALIAIIMLFAAGLGLLFLQKDRIVQFIVDRIPLSWEQSWGDQIFAYVAKDGKIIEGSRWEAQVGEIKARLLPVAEKSGHKFTFHIMQDTNVNAFAMPGGHVVLLTGLLEQAGSAEEVAGVLAHELAHVTERHSMRQMVQSAGLVVLLQALLGDVSGITGILTEGSRFLLQQSFSRDFERDADNVGWAYLTEAKIDPRGMMRFFEKLREIYETSGSAHLESSLALLNTHPTTSERIARLEKKWSETPDKAGFIPIQAWKNPVPEE